MQGSGFYRKQFKRRNRRYANISYKLSRCNRSMKKPEYIIRAEGKKVCKELEE